MRGCPGQGEATVQTKTEGALEKALLRPWVYLQTQGPDRCPRICLLSCS